MNIYQLADELSEYDLNMIHNYDWVVTHYTNGDYDGWGQAIAKIGKELYVYDLGHCSCYGPMDNGPVEIVPIEQYFDLRNDIHEISYNHEIIEKIDELLNA